MSPTSFPDASTAVERERAASIRAARDCLWAFVTSSAANVETAAAAGERALRAALAAGAGAPRLAAELELSPHALSAILDGAVPLRTLHPDEQLRGS